MSNLKGVNFFDMMSYEDKMYFYDMFGTDIFKKHSIPVRTLRFATPFSNTVSYEQFNVLTSKIVRY